MAEFKREDRYLVLKRTDVEAFLDSYDKRLLENITTKVAAGREIKGKQPLESVVVESDWEIYDRVWDLVRQLVEGDLLYDNVELVRTRAEIEDKQLELHQQLNESFDDDMISVSDAIDSEIELLEWLLEGSRG